MANFYQLSTMIAHRAVMGARNEMPLTMRITRDWDNEFGQRGRKIGKIFYIRKENRYLTTLGPDITSALADAAYDYTDPATAALNLDQQPVIPLHFTSQDWTASVDDIDSRITQPAVRQLANVVERSVAGLYAYVGNCVGQGAASVITGLTSNPTPGTALTAGGANTKPYRAFLYANALLHMEGCPVDNRKCVIDPYVQPELLDELKGVFNPTEVIAKQYKKGRIGMQSGMEWAMSQNITGHNTGTAAGIAATVKTAPANGATSIETASWTVSSSNVLKKGDVISLASSTAALSGGTQLVNPLSRVTAGSLRQFSATANVSADALGDATIPISPAIFWEGPYQNVDSRPAVGENVLFWGVNGTTYASKSGSLQSLVFHPSAFGIGFAELPLWDGLHKGSRATDDETGVSVRCTADTDQRTDEVIWRLETWYGVVTIYPEFACRVQTT